MAVIVDTKEGVAKITIDRPPLNLLDISAMKELNRVFESIRGDSDINVVVLYGKGKNFSAGVDIKELTADKARKTIREFNQIFHHLAELEQSTVSVIRGSVLGGGCSLAVFCDMVIASETAKLGQPQIKVGVPPPIATFILPRLIGRKKALEMLLTGDAIDAQEAYRVGLVNQVVADDILEEEADAFVTRLTSLSGIVLKLTKKAIYQGMDKDFNSVIAKIRDYYVNVVMKTIDANEGLRAFMQKRQPTWYNR
jgi:cyclohexa-1,5-dienecarbonyl-CoA hydratase